jgi:NAD(P)-dependent dehydrogenase (short-subunit alcohol dehydrogenase family)
MSQRGTTQWSAADVPDQQGRTAVVTGANSGIGFEAARVLAERGAAVVLACRSLDKADAAAARITAAAPGARVSTVRLDLASLASVREAAQRLRASHERLDLLINNAGLMIPPYGQTEDGFELQFGTNHLGHFALTGLLLDRLLPVPGSRIVTVSSTGHRLGTINFDDLQSAKRYRPMAAYGQSKLANLMFTYDLQRRLAATGAQTIAVAAHPGGSRTELMRHTSPVMRAAASHRLRMLTSMLMQSAEMGALPTLRAAVDPAVRGGEYYGPGGAFQFTGLPVRVESSKRSHDIDVQRRLWTMSEGLTGVTYRYGDLRVETGPGR